MAERRNYLLGRGELITSRVDRISGGPEDGKKQAYSFDEARRRLGPRIEGAASALRALPDDACPDGQAVAAITLHPRYLSKSDHPSDLLHELGLRLIGSKPCMVKPEAWGTTQIPDGESPSADLLVAGTRASFEAWPELMLSWGEKYRSAIQLSRVEDVRAFDKTEKIRPLKHRRLEQLLDVVLHAPLGANILDAFVEYATRLGARPEPNRARRVGGVCFIPVYAPIGQVSDIARFSFVRVVRGMPVVRPEFHSPIRSLSTQIVDGIRAEPISREVSAAVFDGGVPRSVDLGPSLRVIDTQGVSKPQSSYEAHGLAVTSAFLFGPIFRNRAERPPCPVDHFRVLGEAEAHDHGDYYDVLDRIEGVLSRTQYDLVNLSVGPSLAVHDDDVNLWTATIDQLAFDNQFLVTVAAGNNGARDSIAGLNRIQPPADGVNVLSVGACASSEGPVERARYSAIGPGRSESIVKPDGVGYGGSIANPFLVVGPEMTAVGERGTSFAAPCVLRVAALLKAELPDMTALSLRALLVHGTEDSAGELLNRGEVGWGRFPLTAERLLTTPDDTVTVVYQGELPTGRYLRAPIPLPEFKRGKVTISATLCLSTEVEPEHAAAYTRAGCTIVFRPNAGRLANEDSTHAKSEAFFGRPEGYQPESELRLSGKWDTCLKASRRKLATSLEEPCFDIYLNTRMGHEPESGARFGAEYSLIVTVEAPKVADLYDQVLRQYQNQLQPLVPRTQIPIQI